MDEEVQVKCPYCNSKDLSKIPTQAGENANSIIYKCQMCGRTFSKTATPDSQEQDS